MRRNPFAHDNRALQSYDTLEQTALVVWDPKAQRQDSLQLLAHHPDGIVAPCALDKRATADNLEPPSDPEGNKHRNNG